MNILRYLSYGVILVLCIFIFSDFTSAYTEYKVGDEVTYNDIQFYVIKDSSSDEDSITLLKAEPLTVDEVNLYGGVGTENNHVNMYITEDSSLDYYQKAFNQNGYGGMQYYSSSTCKNGGIRDCKTDYNLSEIKYVVDAWMADNNGGGDIIEARLISLDELINNLGYSYANISGTTYIVNNDYTPKWVYDNKYSYWTSSSFDDSSYNVWFVDSSGRLDNRTVSYLTYDDTVRPVITLKKSAIAKKENVDDDIVENLDEGKIDESNKENENNEQTNEIKTIVNVPNTMQKVSIILIMIGIMLISVSIVIVIRNRK